MDAGVIALFKVLYRRRVLDRLLLNVDNAARGSQEPDLKITLLMATQFIFGAWCGVRASTVRNCFRQAGFVRRRHEEEAGEEEAIPGEATEAPRAPDDEGVPQLWSVLHEDASGLDENVLISLVAFFLDPLITIIGYNDGIFLALGYCYKWTRLYIYIVVGFI
ncbi:hypothetical protein HPB48_001821 [Haemaphysalis longicornis]|uniref:Uncharacterized protein n=1 Tax=Haemaphysalis longicornis TaxID=44386 RepID=A0A9J6G605_HAELO|nr:hypothetical protein HPB48_001821 [Haemaphysalis longicornis]